MSALLGAFMFALTVAFFIAFPHKSDHLPQGFFTPIIAFEFIQTEQEVFTMFTSGTESIQQELVVAMDGINRFDFFYMTVYSMLLLSFTLSCAKISGKRYFYLGACLAVVILLTDFLENLQLLGITARLETGGFGPHLGRLQVFTWIKWASIATCFLLLSPWFLGGNIFSRFIAGLSMVTALLALASFIHRSILNELFAISVGLMFLCLTVYSFLYQKHGLE